MHNNEYASALKIHGIPSSYGEEDLFKEFGNRYRHNVFVDNRIHFALKNDRRVAFVEFIDPSKMHHFYDEFNEHIWNRDNFNNSRCRLTYSDNKELESSKTIVLKSRNELHQRKYPETGQQRFHQELPEKFVNYVSKGNKNMSQRNEVSPRSTSSIAPRPQDHELAPVSQNPIAKEVIRFLSWKTALYHSHFMKF